MTKRCFLASCLLFLTNCTNGVLDVTGGGGDGASCGTPSTFSQAVAFNGSTGKINIIQGPLSPGSFTIEMFVKTGAGGGGGMFFWNIQGASTGIVLAWDQVNKRMEIKKPSTSCISAPSSSYTPLNSMMANSKYHVALVLDGASYSAYVNGAIGVSGTMTSGCSYQNPVIGENGAGSYFDGMIDELRISNYVRYSTSFIPPTGPFNGCELGTTLLFHFDDGFTSGPVTYANPAASFNFASGAAFVASPFP